MRPRLCGDNFFRNKPMTKASFNWADPFLLDSQLAADERQVRNAARDFAQKALKPRIRDAFRNETTDPAIYREMGEMGLLGCTLPPAYGGAGQPVPDRANGFFDRVRQLPGADGRRE